MSWVRENTEDGSIFVHWWDYGYWVEYLGQRPTLADGGHFQGEFRTHMIGRYLLTNPNPESAMSFIKSNEASYLLIDPTDLGKYSAYSLIGSGEGETANDRYSWLPVIPVASSQTRDTRNGVLRVYQGGTVLDSDIVYNENGSEIFLPSGIAGLGGVLIESSNTTFSQPKGVYIYNNQQITIPIRYLYTNGKLYDFGGGINATVMAIPSFSGTQIEQMGAVIYLSEKTMNSLFAQLYLMNDPNNLYPGITLSHSEDNQVTAYLKSQGLNIGEFIYYQGLQGPIKIWNTENIPDYILEKEEFRRFEGKFAEFDDLIVKK